jgi:hypothetical protein
LALLDEGGMSDYEYKQCPDCAEQVLEAARKCRYCGFRFDSRRDDHGSRLSGLRPTRFAGANNPTLTEVLADWGLTPRDGEHVAYFHVAALDGRPGYLLVSSERLVFFEQAPRRESKLAVEFPLSEFSARVRRRMLNRRLELCGRGFRHVVDDLRGKELARIASYITQQRLTTMTS